ncbi:MAG: RrF2 family transcriptional regulator [Cellulosilyticaceae bacterium]
MKISTKGRYGLRSLIDLAVHDEDAPISLAIIAKRQGISMNYLEQVIAILKRSQIVKSIKGANGGYKLNTSIHQLTLKEILTVLEGDLKVIEYDALPEQETPLVRCVREAVWQPIDDAVDKVLCQLTLADMVEEYRSLEQGKLSYFYSYII